MKKSNQTVKIFRYIEALDAFVVTEAYARIAEALGLAEWNPVVWMGRLFTLDNDYGEHWFDNWELREERREEAQALGIDADELLIIEPQRFQDGRDGPCHSPEQRRRFWTDVLRSLEVSYEVLFEEARGINARAKDVFPEDAIADLESRIERILSEST